MLMHINELGGYKSEKMWKRYNAIEERDLLNAASKLKPTFKLTLS